MGVSQYNPFVRGGSFDGNRTIRGSDYIRGCNPRVMEQELSLQDKIVNKLPLVAILALVVAALGIVYL